MAIQPVAGATRSRVQYVADGKIREFPVPFAVYDVDDLQVYFDRNQQTDGFSVLGNEDSLDLRIAFERPPSTGTLVTLRSHPVSGRTATYQDYGLLHANVLNSEFDKLTSAVQQLEIEASRSLHLHPADGDASLELPDKTGRASRAIVFDETGNLSLRPIHDVPSLPLLTLGDIAEDEQFSHFTHAEKAKLGCIEAGAQVNTVVSVHGRTGTVVGQAGDYNAEQITETANKVVMTAAERTKLGGVEKGAQVNTVATVHGRTGTVVGQAGDYNAEQITETTDKVVMTAAERNKLTNIAAGAQVNPTRVSAAEKTAGTATTIRSYAPVDVRDMVATFAPGSAVASVAGKTGAVTLLKDDVGLSNLSNDLQIKADPGAYGIKSAPDANDLLLLYTAQTSGTPVPKTVPWSSISTGSIPTILPGAVPFINAMASPYSADGTRASSAQTAIQNALNAAATRREAVFLAGGAFKVTNLRIPRGVNLVGAGPFSTIVSPDEVAFAADGGDSMIDALANSVQAVAKSEVVTVSGSPTTVYYWGFTLYPAATGYMKLANKQSFTIPRIVTISSAAGDADCSDLVFEVRGLCPDASGTVIESFNGAENGGDPNTANNRGTMYSKNVFTSAIEVRLVNTPAPTESDFAAKAVAPMMGNRFVHIGIIPPPLIRIQSGNQKNPGVHNLGIAGSSASAPFFASPVVVRDATGIQLSSIGNEVNAPQIDNIFITGCVRGIVMYGGIRDSTEPVQKIGIQNIEIQCANTMDIPERPSSSGVSYRAAIPSASTHLNLASGFYLRGQIDTPTFFNVNVKGWDDGLDQTPEGLNSIGYWWPSSRLCGQAKGGSGVIALGIQTRYLRYGFMIGEGQVRTGLFYGDFENSHTLMWVGKNNRGIKIGGGFAHPGGYYGFPGPAFYVDAGSTLTVDYGFFEGSYQGNPWFCEGAGRIYFSESVRFATNGSHPTIPAFNMATPLVTRFTGGGSAGVNLEELRITDWAPYAKMGTKTTGSPAYTGTEDVSDIQCFIPPGQTMTIGLLGATIFKESAGGNLAVPTGTGAAGARTVTYSKQVTLLALTTRLTVGSSTTKTVVVLSGA